ncbi:hypothetical protein [Catalinimonas alkaloidigena]|uniref:hypothetical protein n=1 Tax=Catalinimonas alkaloidigena TaxID=1075417 RepID=UPI00116006A9|nr:hypothetical protein [Catalinimonas alkaloidigena]
MHYTKTDRPADRIAQVLSDWNYATALAIYQDLGTSAFMKQLLASGESVYTTRRLRAELEELLSTAEIGGAAVPSPLPRRIAVNDEFAHAPEAVQALQVEWKDLYKISNHLRLKLPLIVRQQDRAPLCREIRSHFDRIHDLWTQLDYYRAHGELPPNLKEVTVAIEDRAQLERRRNTLRTYLSRARNGTRPSDKVPAWEAELRSIEKKLLD